MKKTHIFLVEDRNNPESKWFYVGSFACKGDAYICQSALKNASQNPNHYYISTDQKLSIIKINNNTNL